MSKDLFMEVRIKAEMDEETFNDIPITVRDRMKIKAIEAANFEQYYKADMEWKKRHEQVVEAIKHQREREDEIRVEIRSNHS